MRTLYYNSQGAGREKERGGGEGEEKEGKEGEERKGTGRLGDWETGFGLAV